MVDPIKPPPSTKSSLPYSKADLNIIHNPHPIAPSQPHRSNLVESSICLYINTRKLFYKHDGELKFYKYTTPSLPRGLRGVDV